MRVHVPLVLAVIVAPAAAHADSLGDALAAAYRNNPTLEAARLEARAADEDIAQARAGYLPTLDVAASASTRETDVIVPDGLGGTITTNEQLDPVSVGVVAEQALYTGGLRGAQGRAARASVELSRQSLRAVEQRVMLAAIAAYVDVRRDEEFVRIRMNDVELLQRRLDESRARFDVGEITLTDVAQSEARLAGSLAGLSEAQAALEASRARFLQVVGEAPGALDLPPPPPALPGTHDEAVEIALEAHPDIRAALAAERLSQAQVGIERSALMPRLSIVGRWDRTQDSVGPDIETETTSAAAQLSIPLFEGGFSRSRVRQSRINVRRSEQVTEETRRAIVAEATAAWNDYLSAQRVVVSTQEQARANELAFEGVREEETVGLRTSLDVLNAQQEWLEAQLAVARAQRDAYVAAHLLLQAVGALDAEALHVNVPLYDPEQHARAVRRTILSTEPAELELRGR